MRIGRDERELLRHAGRGTRLSWGRRNGRAMGGSRQGPWERCHDGAAVGPGQDFACPCTEEHFKTVHLSPSNPNYELNLRKWLERQPCWAGEVEAR